MKAKVTNEVKLSKDVKLYLKRKKRMKMVTNFFLFCLITGMCFAILYPVIKLFPTVFNDLEDLGNPDVIYIPIKKSVLSFVAAWRLMMKIGIMTMGYTISYSAIITFIEVFISAMVGYSLARVNFKGSKIVFFMVILVFLVPPQALLLSQYIHFKNFDILGMISGLNGDTLDLINKPITLYMLALTGFGVNQSLFIFIFRQFFKNIPKELEEAAMIDGCNFNKTYFRIMLPNAKPAISTVAVLGFVWNYGDTYYTGYFHPSGSYLAYILQTVFDNANKDYTLNAMKIWYKLPLVSDFSFDAVKQASVLIYLIPLLIVYFIAQHWLVENLENSGIVG